MTVGQNYLELWRTFFAPFMQKRKQTVLYLSNIQKCKWKLAPHCCFSKHSMAARFKSSDSYCIWCIHFYENVMNKNSSMSTCLSGDTHCTIRNPFSCSWWIKYCCLVFASECWGIRGSRVVHWAFGYLNFFDQTGNTQYERLSDPQAFSLVVSFMLHIKELLSETVFHTPGVKEQRMRRSLWTGRAAAWIPSSWHHFPLSVSFNSPCIRTRELSSTPAWEQLEEQEAEGQLVKWTITCDYLYFFP